MILILSYKAYEQGTDPIIEWLLYYNYPFKKVVIEDLLSTPLSLDSQNGDVFFDGINLSNEVQVIFYRRFKKNIPIRLEGGDLGSVSKKIIRESNYELDALVDYMFFLLKDKYWIPKCESFSVNKEIVLKKAREVGLLVPRSIVTNSKCKLEKFESEVKKIVYKPIDQISYYTIGPYTYSCYTTEIKRSIKNSLPEIFFPSLFQELIEAEYEIRTFFLDGEFFSSAIIRSQISLNHNIDIKLDFNKVETDWVNYTLPRDIKRKLVALMKKLGLNTGSIDIIKGINGKFYFIEVNPVGQYLAPSFLCNYNIDKRIAECLIEKDKNLSQLYQQET